MYLFCSCFLKHLLLSFILDKNEKGEEVMEDRPCSADSECRQAAKTINADGQKKLRAEKQGESLERSTRKQN